MQVLLEDVGLIVALLYSATTTSGNWHESFVSRAH